jgi:F-type H+-transporting ATPase subunit gamma
MTGRRKIELQRRSLDEIRDIMNSIKTLAYMESRKLSHSLEMEHNILDNISSVAADFVTSYPETLSLNHTNKTAIILIGSERGFCGDFNEALLRYLEDITDSDDKDTTPMLIVIGHKLCSRFADDARVLSFLEGAGVAEEVEKVLARVVEILEGVQKEHGALSVSAIYHDVRTDGIIMKQLIPAFKEYIDQPLKFPVPPFLNTEPEQFLLELLDQYLITSLQELFYNSLMAENLKRAHDLEGAIQHLDNRSVELKRRSNALRQEEIIEEIEVILLTATGLSKIKNVE